MGCYINPGGWGEHKPSRPQWISKEEFLGEFGIQSLNLEEFADPLNCPAGMLPVVWVDNGRMTAAGIAYSPSELAEFLYPDARPKRYFYVEVETLKEVSPLEDYLKRYGRWFA